MSTPEEQGGEELRHALRRQGWAHVRVRGTSMRPTILSGELIRIVPATGFARGDVVTFVLDDVVVTHRVVTVTGTEIICRGDGRPLADPPVAREAVIGRAVEVVGRGPLAGGPRVLALVDARRAVTGARKRARRLLEESGLLLRQVCSRPAPRMEPTTGGLPELPLDEGWRVLEPQDLLPGGSVGEPAQEADRLAPLVVPAGVFSALDEAGRRQVLASLQGRPALVCALPLERAGRLVQAYGGVRQTLRRVGVRGGEPGDGVLHAVPGAPPGVVHYVSAAALASEMRRAGLVVERVEVRPSDWGAIVCASAAPDLGSRGAQGQPEPARAISTSDNTC